jgi:hypothetical protein
MGSFLMGCWWKANGGFSGGFFSYLQLEDILDLVDRM